MIIDVIRDTNKFVLSFSSATERLEIEDICALFKLEANKRIVIDSWMFLNNIGKLSEYLRINNLKGKLIIGEKAKKVILNTKKNYIVNSKTEFKLTQGQVSVELDKLGFKRELTISQERNIAYLLNSTVGADFSVPGAGKTTTAFSLYCIRKNKDKNLKMLIICPKNVFGAWEDENNLCFYRPMSICRLEGGVNKICELLSKNIDIFLMTYEQLLTVNNYIEKFINDNDVSVYLDECHKIKGGLKGKIGRKVLNLANLPKYKNIMSGTPMPNSLNDLVSLYQFLYPLQSVENKTVVDKIQTVYVRTTKKDLELEPYEVIKKELKLIQSIEIYIIYV